jgi:acetate kinase
MTSSTLLTINSGSSSVKFQLFANDNDLKLLAYGKVVNLGTKPAFSAVDTELQHKTKQELDTRYEHKQAISLILDWVEQHLQSPIAAAAHRVVHGGTFYTHSVLVDAEVLAHLEQLIPLAPLHQPHNLTAIKLINAMDATLPQIACFDTAFHATHSPLFTSYALPYSLRQQGIRRFGFHGLSFEWIVHSLKQQHTELAQGRVVIAHLGNGCSLCAVHNGISIDTTMGLTALDGLPMGTRSGSIDPGAITYMMRELNLSAGEIEQLLYNESGLLGLSGLTNDVKELEQSTDEQAQFALKYFCLKTAQYIGMTKKG